MIACSGCRAARVFRSFPAGIHWIFDFNVEEPFHECATAARGVRVLPRLPQGVPRRHPAPGHSRADARNCPAPVRQGAAADGLRPLRPLHRPAGQHRHRARARAPARAPGSAPAATSRRTRAARCSRWTTACAGGKAAPEFPQRRAPLRARTGARGDAARLRARRASSPRRWSTSPSARTSAARSARASGTRRRELRRRDSRVRHAGVRARRGCRAAAPSSRPTSTTRNPSR